jgi:hypothetical protein
LKKLSSYFYAYEILFTCFHRSPISFLFQFLVHRYIEITSILVAALVNGIMSNKAHIIIGVIALVQLFASLMINESYIKIVPYLRIIYLDNRVVAYYLLANTVAPFLLYVFFSRLIVSDNQAIQNILLVCLLLLNNILFAHILHMFSFSIKETMVFYPVILGIYLIVFLRIDFLVMPVTTTVLITLFMYKIRSY